jgi:hypothetical protein
MKQVRPKTTPPSGSQLLAGSLVFTALSGSVSLKELGPVAAGIAGVSHDRSRTGRRGCCFQILRQQRLLSECDSRPSAVHGSSPYTYMSLLGFRCVATKQLWTSREPTMSSENKEPPRWSDVTC